MNKELEDPLVAKPRRIKRIFLQTKAAPFVSKRKGTVMCCDQMGS